jgi:hypothetical protein
MNHETCIEILGRKLHMGHKIGVHLLGFIVLLKPNLKGFKYCICDSFQLMNHKLKPSHFHWYPRVGIDRVQSHYLLAIFAWGSQKELLVLKTSNHFKHGGLKLMRVLHFWIGLSPNHLQLELNGFHRFLCVDIASYKTLNSKP